MSLIDEYGEWRRRRAFEASLRGRELARELALVAEILMERRGVGRRPRERKHESSVGKSPEAYEPSGSPRATRESHRNPRGESSERARSGSPVILAAIDGTIPSAEAGRHAVRLARGLGAKLLVLHFINVEPTRRMGAYRILALAEMEHDSREVAEQTRKMAEESGVECEARRGRGPRPSRAIVAVAEEVGAYCVVIGSPGASWMDRLLDRAIGGAYEKVLREARCPVLSVRR